MPARLGIEFLDGIAQHGAGHCGCMLVKKRGKFFGITFAGLAQHPSGSLVNQRLTVIQKYFRQFGSQRRLAVFYVCESSDYSNAPAPKVAVVHKLAQQIVSKQCCPMIWGAERSTRSQLFMRDVFAR